MKLQHLKNLIKVVELGSISEAAKQMYVSQSSISSSIKKIEAEYGVIIFERTSKGVRLTREGEEILIDFERILLQIQYMEKKYSKNNNNSQRLCISSQHHINSLDAYLEVLETIEESNYRLGFLECKTQDILENIEKGISDIGVIYYTQKSKGAMVQELRNKNLIFNHIAYGKTHVYIRKEHPLSHKNKIRIHEIEPYPFITYDQIINSISIFTESNNRHYNIRKIIYANDRAVACAIIKSTDAYLVGSGYNGDSGIVTIPLEDGDKIEIGWLSKLNFKLSGIYQEYISNLIKKYEKIHPID